MGFFDKFMSKKESELKSEKVKFSDLPSWIEQRKGELGGDITDNFSNDISEALSKMREKLSELETAEMEKDVEQRIKSIVASSRDNYISGVRKLIGDIDVGGNPIKLSDELNAVLGKVQKVDIKYGQRANFGFSDELSRVKKELNKLVDVSNKLNESLAERKKKLKSLKAVENQLKNINEVLEEINRLEDRKGNALEELRENRKGKSDSEKNINSIEHSERAEKVSAIGRELEELKAKKQELESFVLNVLGPLKRVFKKYARAVAEGKVSGFNVDRYAEDPVETYLRGEHTLPDLLAKVQKAIQTKIISLDGNEGDKALKKIRAISFSYLEKMRSEYNESTSKIRTLEVQLKELSVTKELERYQREVDGLDEKIDSAEKRINKRKEDIESKKLELDEMKRVLSDKVSDFVGGKCELI